MNKTTKNQKAHLFYALLKKIPIAMRITLLLLFVLTFQLQAEHIYSQNAKISLDMKNSTIEKVLQTIEEKSDYYFLYNNRLINVDRKVSVRVRNAAISAVLERLFKSENVDYEVKGSQIILSPKEIYSQITAIAEAVQQQKKAITGTVVDAAGVPIIGANIIEAGTTNGTVTDVDGKFSLSVENNAIIHISYIGYLEQSIATAGKSVFNITLIEDTKALEELVVVGYGSISKRELTSAVSSIKSEDFIQGAFNSPLSLIDGKVSGVNVSNVAAADPNAEPNIQVRGASSLEAGNSPLIIVDGLPGANLRNITNQDIESITILKDGSAAAIYGSRAANGVIIIETKKGQAGKVSVSYEAYLDHDMVADKPNILSAEEFVNKKRDIDFGYRNDWYESLINKNNIGQSHYISISGGGENLTFRASANYKTKEGLDLTSSRKEYGARMGFASTIFDNKLEVSGNLSSRVVNEEYANYNAFHQAVKLNPTQPMMDPENPDRYSILYGHDTYNPVGMVKDMQNGGDRQFSLADFKIKLNILPTLNTELTIGRQSQDYLNKVYVNSYHKESIDNMRRGRATLRSEEWTDYTLEWIGNYYAQVDNHTIKLMAGYSYQEFNHQFVWAENANFPSDLLSYNKLSSGDWNLAAGRLGMDSGKDKEKTIGFPMRLNYNFDDTFFLTSSLRYEGNTKFGSNHKWGLFPAASAAWNLTKLSYVKNLNIFDDLKLRASFGTTGRSGFNRYSALATYGSSSYWQNETGQWIQSWGPAKNPNPDLRWEKQVSYNLGIDFSIVDNKISGALDIFSRKGKDVISNYDAPLPPYIYSQVFTNVASTSSKGFEFSINWDLINTDNLSYVTNIVATYTLSKLDKFSNEVFQKGFMDRYNLPAPGNPGYAQRLKDGTEIGTFWGLKYAGVDEDGNMLVWKDAKVGTEKILASGEAGDLDKGAIGNGSPRYFLSWNNKLKYKNFDLSLYFQGKFDFQILNMYQMYFGLTAEPGINLLTDAYNKNGHIKSGKVVSDYFLEDGDYLQLDNITLGWTSNWKSNLIKSLRFYTTIKNAFTITKYSVMSPTTVEINGLNPGISGLGVYPEARSITFGSQITF